MIKYQTSNSLNLIRFKYYHLYYKLHQLMSEFLQSSQIPNSIHQHTSNSCDIMNFTLDSQTSDDKENFGLINIVKQKSCEDGDCINNNQTQGSQRLDSKNLTSNYSAF